MKQTIIDDCLQYVDNRFELARVIAYRTKQLNRGLKPLAEKRNDKNIILSMREIAAGKVFLVHNESNENND
jgi:DNA-directed RNA polymerase subunit omega